MITSVHDHLRFAQHKRGWECTLSASSSLAVLHALQPCSHPPSTLCRIVPSNQAQAHALRGIVSTNHAQPYTLGRLEIPTCYRGRILVGGPPCMVPKNLWPTGSKRRHPANGAEWVPVKHYAHFSFWRCPTNSAGAGSSDHTVVAMYGLMTITCGRLIQRSLASSVIIFALLLQQQ